MRRRSCIFSAFLAVLLFGAGPALAQREATSDIIPDAPVGPEGRSLGTAEDATNCPYIAALQTAAPGSFEDLIIRIGTMEGGLYTKRDTDNRLGMYLFSEAALQDCVMTDTNPFNNNYGGDLNDDGTAPSKDIVSSDTAENWKEEVCEIQSSDMDPVSANIRSSQDFLMNPCLQEALIRKELLDVRTILSDPHVRDIMCHKITGTYTVEHNEEASNLGETVEGGVFITPSGLLYAAHVLGVEGLRQAISVFIGGGSPAMSLPTYTQDADGNVTQASGAGTAIPPYPAGYLLTDGNDKPWTALVAAANYFEVPDGGDPDCTSTVNPGEVPTYGEPDPPPYVYPEYGTPPKVSTDYPRDKAGDIPTLPAPPKIIKEVVHEIEVAAGVPNTEINEFPSYNEIMLAYTRYRFFNPTYFADMADTAGAIKQEQTMIDSFISVQMKDIYDMQEKINALLAARAALKYNMDPLPSRAEQSGPP